MFCEGAVMQVNLASLIAAQSLKPAQVPARPPVAAATAQRAEKPVFEPLPIARAPASAPAPKSPRFAAPLPLGQQIDLLV